MACSIGGQIVFEFQTIPGYLVEFDASNERDLENVLAFLEADLRVAQAYPDLLLSPNDSDEEAPVPMETLLLPPDRNQAYLDAGMEDAWNTMNQIDNLSPVSIAVIDTGFVGQTGNAAIDGVLRSEFDPARFQIRQGMGNGDHGTNVTGVMVARNNHRSNARVTDESFRGVVTSVNNIEYGVVLSLEPTLAGFSAAMEDIILSKNQIDVVNISMAAPPCDHWLTNLYCAFYRHYSVMLMGGMPGVTFVTAAGNGAEDASNVFPANVSGELANAITVGATIDKVRRRPSSNFGPSTRERCLDGKSGCVCF